MKLRVKVPDVHTIVHKGEHFFHASYTGAEAMFGHGILSHLATGAFLMIVVDLVLHFAEHGGNG